MVNIQTKTLPSWDWKLAVSLGPGFVAVLPTAGGLMVTLFFSVGSSPCPPPTL